MLARASRSPSEQDRLPFHCVASRDLDEHFRTVPEWPISGYIMGFSDGNAQIVRTHARKGLAARFDRGDGRASRFC